MALQTLCLIAVIVALILLWWRQMQLHERAVIAARRYCEKNQLQLLDDSVSFRGFKRHSIQFGTRRWMQRYLFEFTATGDERYIGEILFYRGQMWRVRTPAYRIE